MKLTDLIKKWQKEGDAFLLIKPEYLKINDLRYLTGFAGSTGIFFQTKNKNFLFVDGRYFEMMKNYSLTEIEIKLWDRNIFKFIKSIIRKEKIKKIITESYLSYSLIKRLEKLLKVKIMPKENLVSSLRIQKTDLEIEKLKKAQVITDRIFEEILNFIKPEKQTEKEIAFKIYELAIKKYKCEALSFEPIVASGEGSSIPHYFSSFKLIKNNKPLLIDFGIVFDGYVSDMTRTIWIGNKVDSDFKKAYYIVLEAQKRAINACFFKKEKKAKEIDKVARDYIEKNGYKGKFIHSTGHGIGLDIHEAPTLSPFSKEKLKGKEVVTIEPGIYLEGKWGIRIEDAILTGEGENFTKSPKNLIKL